MGAWGVGEFENDDAADWAYELEAAEDFDLVRSVLTSVIGNADYLQAMDGSLGLAAAAVVAAARPDATASLPEPAASWVAAHRSQLLAEDLPLALAAVDRVLGDDSELPDLFDEASASTRNAWQAVVQALRRRLIA